MNSYTFKESDLKTMYYIYQKQKQPDKAGRVKEYAAEQGFILN